MPDFATPGAKRYLSDISLDTSPRKPVEHKLKEGSNSPANKIFSTLGDTEKKRLEFGHAQDLISLLEVEIGQATLNNNQSELGDKLRDLSQGLKASKDLKDLISHVEGEINPNDIKSTPEEIAQETLNNMIIKSLSCAALVLLSFFEKNYLELPDAFSDRDPLGFKFSGINNDSCKILLLIPLISCCIDVLCILYLKKLNCSFDCDDILKSLGKKLKNISLYIAQFTSVVNLSRGYYRYDDLQKLNRNLITLMELIDSSESEKLGTYFHSFVKIAREKAPALSDYGYILAVVEEIKYFIQSCGVVPYVGRPLVTLLSLGFASLFIAPFVIEPPLWMQKTAAFLISRREAETKLGDLLTLPFIAPMISYLISWMYGVCTINNKIKGSLVFFSVIQKILNDAAYVCVAAPILCFSCYVVLYPADKFLHLLLGFGSVLEEVQYFSGDSSYSMPFSASLLLVPLVIKVYGTIFNVVSKLACLAADTIFCVKKKRCVNLMTILSDIPVSLLCNFVMFLGLVLMYGMESILFVSESCRARFNNAITRKFILCLIKVDYRNTINKKMLIMNDYAERFNGTLGNKCISFGEDFLRFLLSTMFLLATILIVFPLIIHCLGHYLEDSNNTSGTNPPPAPPSPAPPINNGCNVTVGFYPKSDFFYFVNASVYNYMVSVVVMLKHMDGFNTSAATVRVTGEDDKQIVTSICPEKCRIDLPWGVGNLTKAVKLLFEDNNGASEDVKGSVKVFSLGRGCDSKNRTNMEVVAAPSIQIS